MIAGFEHLRSRGAADARRRPPHRHRRGRDRLRRRGRARRRRRAASSATCRRSTTPSSACSATAASTSAPSTAWRSCRSTRSTCRPRTRGALASAARRRRLPLSAMVKDDERCIRCGLCAIRCPTDAMTMERFTITERLVAERPTSVRRRVRRHERTTQPRHGPTRLPAQARHRRRRGGASPRRPAASLRSLVPNVSYDAPTTVKLGPPADFPDGLKFLPDERLFVFREGQDVPRDLGRLHAPGLHRPGRGAGSSPQAVDGRRRSRCG